MAQLTDTGFADEGIPLRPEAGDDIKKQAIAMVARLAAERQAKQEAAIAELQAAQQKSRPSFGQALAGNVAVGLAEMFGQPGFSKFLAARQVELRQQERKQLLGQVLAKAGQFSRAGDFVSASKVLDVALKSKFFDEKTILAVQKMQETLSGKAAAQEFAIKLGAIQESSDKATEKRSDITSATTQFLALGGDVKEAKGMQEVFGAEPPEPAKELTDPKEILFAELREQFGSDRAAFEVFKVLTAPDIGFGQQADRYAVEMFKMPYGKLDQVEMASVNARIQREAIDRVLASKVLPVGVQERLAGVRSAKAVVEEIRKLYISKVQTGIVKGITGPVWRLLGLESEKDVRFLSHMRAFAMEFIRARTGAQASNQELLRELTEFPSLKDEPATWLGKMNAKVDLLNIRERVVAELARALDPRTIRATAGIEHFVVPGEDAAAGVAARAADTEASVLREYHFEEALAVRSNSTIWDSLSVAQRKAVTDAYIEEVNKLDAEALSKLTDSQLDSVDLLPDDLRKAYHNRVKAIRNKGKR
jgi:hypothetical protein